MERRRASSPEQRQALKRAVGRVVRLAGGQESASTITRVSPQTLSDYANTAAARHLDTFAPLDVVLDLCLDVMASGEAPLPLLELCRICGGAFAPLPSGQRGAGLADALAAAIAAHGAAASAVVPLFTLSKPEAAGAAGDALVRLDEALEALAALRAAVAALADANT